MPLLLLELEGTMKGPYLILTPCAPYWTNCVAVELIKFGFMDLNGTVDREGKRLRRVKRLLAALKLASKKNKIIVRYAMIVRKLPVRGFNAVRDGLPEGAIAAKQEVSNLCQA